MALTPQTRSLVSADDSFPTAQLFLLGESESLILAEDNSQSLTRPSNMSRGRADRLDLHLPILMGDGQGFPHC